jgi:mevalonate kinase
MVGGGLMQIIAYGVMDIYLTNTYKNKSNKSYKYSGKNNFYKQHNNKINKETINKENQEKINIKNNNIEKFNKVIKKIKQPMNTNTNMNMNINNGLTNIFFRCLSIKLFIKKK